MKYDFLTVDTNIFDQNGLHLDTGLLGQLKQFKQGSVRLVLSEIVLREVHAHLVREHRAGFSRLENAIRDAKKIGLLEKASLEMLTAATAEGAKAEEAVKRKLDQFIEETGSEVVRVDNVSMDGLVKSYFDEQAPFEGSGNKKHEFPDAIALLSLEAWASKSGKKILAISNDKGWESFASKSKCIDVEKDISKAFQLFQNDVEEARKIFALLVDGIENGKLTNLVDQINQALNDELSNIDPDIEADCYLAYEAELDELVLNDFEFVRGSNNELLFNITQIGKDRISAKCNVSMQVSLTAAFDFFVYDSIDKDTVSMGGDVVQLDTAIKMPVLITLTGDFKQAETAVSIEAAEILDNSPTIHLGHVEPFNDQAYEE